MSFSDAEWNRRLERLNDARCVCGRNIPGLIIGTHTCHCGRRYKIDIDPEALLSYIRELVAKLSELETRVSALEATLKLEVRGGR